MKFRRVLVAILLAQATVVMMETAGAAERQVTRDQGVYHALDNNDNFSPDDRFLVFDTRTAAGGIGASRMIGKVEIATGRITPLYRAESPNRFGPGVGAASFAHARDEVIFIHGPFHPTGADNEYEKHRRVGVLCAGDGSGASRLADARDTRPPYTAGALRGGTHRHERSGDGNWVGFTYNDAVVRAFGRRIGKDLDLRTIGVTRLGRPVSVPPATQFPSHADGFSVLVVVVVPDPKPGSDEISHADRDCWVGRTGYVKPDGSRQLARAFIGTTRDRRGGDLDELFVVDIPGDITRPGSLGPLAGTDEQFPMPPAGTVQRRLTHTAERRFPGCDGVVRASHDGQQLALRMRDEQGDWQIFLISPLGGTPRQATFLAGGVDSGPRWHPSGNAIVCVAGTRIVVTVVRPGPKFGQSWTLNDREPAPLALVWSHDGKTVAYNRMVKTGAEETMQIFVADYPDADGDGVPDGLDG